MNRQKKALLFLFVLFILALVYSYWMMPDQKRVTSQTSDKPVETARQDKKQSNQFGKNTLRIDLLDKEPTRYEKPKRDIFNFAVKRQKPAVKPRPKPVAVKPPVRPRPTPVVTPVVRQQLARFTLHGFLIKNDVLTVFLSRGEELFLVREGDRFGDDEQFTALSITREMMVINQDKDSRTIEIPLVEKEPLIPTVQEPEARTVNRRPMTVQGGWPKATAPNIQ